MGVYSVSPYGAGTVYGSLSLSQFAADFVIRPQGYGGLFLSWSLPGGAWSDLRLVRSSYGHPTSISDGVTLVDEDSESAPTSFMDSGLRSGRFYYYTMFVYATSDGRWVPAAKAMGLVVADHSYDNTMWDLLPQVYRTYDANYAEGTEEGPLRRFMGLLGYQMDRTRTEIDTLLQTSNIDRVSGGLLPALGNSLGVGYEPELGMRISRSLVSNAIHLTKTKGTVLGVEGAASTYTNFGADAVVGKNLLLDINHSGWVEGATGHWLTTNATLDAYTEAEHTPAVPGSGTLRVLATGAGDVTVDSGSHAGFTLVPISPGTEYTASLYVQTASTTRTVNISLTFYAADGTALTTTDGTAAADSTGWVRRSVTATSGATAQWAAITATITGSVADEEHRFSAAQIEAGGTATDWESARQVHVYFDPVRTNLVPNPSLEVDTSGWAAGASTALARSTAQAKSGAASLSLTRTGTVGDASAATTTGAGGMTVEAGEAYTASAHVLPDTAVRNVRVDIVWYTDAGAVVSTSAGAAVTEVGGEWVRVSTTATAPGTAARAAVIVVAEGAAVGETHYVDGVLFEQTEFLKSYFDASLFPPSDYLWASTEHASSSFHYPRRTLKDSRLADVLPQYVPAGTTIQTHYGEAVPASAI